MIDAIRAATDRADIVVVMRGSTTAVAEVTVTPDGAFRGRLLPAYITAPDHPELR